MKKLLGLLLATSMLMTLVSCGSSGRGTSSSQSSGNGNASEKIKVKVSLTTPKTHENYIRTEAMCNAINEDCGGVFNFELYPSDSLGDWTLVSEEVVRGNVEMSISSFACTNLAADLVWAPYLATSYEQALKVFSQDGFIYQTIEDIYYEEGVTLLGYDFMGFDGLAFGSKYPKEGDVFGGGEGLITRTSGEEHLNRLVEAMGYSPTNMAWTEIYTSLQTGVIEGFTGCAPSLAYTQFADLLDCYIDCHMLTEIVPIFVNNTFFEGLTEEQQAAFRKHAGAMFESSVAATEEEGDAYFRKLEEEYGVKIIHTEQAKIDALADYCRSECWPSLEPLLGSELYNKMIEYYHSL